MAHSKALNRKIDLALDAAGMRGVVRRGEVADHLLRTASGDWAAADHREAERLYLLKDIAKRMKRPLSDEVKERIVNNVPEEYWPLFNNLKSFICIGTSGGSNAPHVMTINATEEHFKLHYDMMDALTNAVRRERDRSRDLRTMIIALGITRLADL